jgi:hypothetical protein
MALGLALGCLNPELTAFDLSRSMRTPLSLREIFPWGELISEAAIVLFMGFMLSSHSGEVDAAYAAAKAECADNKILASKNLKELEEEKRDLTKKIEVIHTFLDSRLSWASYMRDISSRLPDNIQITSFQGAWPLEINGKRGGKKSFTMQAKAILAPDGSVPREVGDFLVSLRNHAMLKRDFPDISVSSIRPNKGNANTQPTADFSILCRPLTAKGPAPKSPADKNAKSEDNKNAAPDGKKSAKPEDKKIVMHEAVKSPGKEAEKAAKPTAGKSDDKDSGKSAEKEAK